VVKRAFVEVLKLAKTMGLLKIGTVSIDGTHLRANASKDRNVRSGRAGELEAERTAAIDRLPGRAEQADASGGGDDQSLPVEVGRLEKLRAKVQAARQQPEAEAKRKG